MATLTVKVSWGKEKYDIALDAAGDVLSFKAQLQSLTGVSAERQKIMCKAWKGTLKDDAVFSSMPDLKDGIAMTLMGSADTVAKPAAPVVFVEDLPKGAAAAAGKGIPVGLENTGNTCYLNSTVEALRFIPELKDAVVDARTRAGRAGPADLAASLGDLYKLLDVAPAAVAPAAFTRRVRQIFPQFDETGPHGGHKQQDAEEFLTSLLAALAGELTQPTSAVPVLSPAPVGAPANVLDTLMGLELDVELTCMEPGAGEAVSRQRDSARKLVCNIDGGAGKVTQINHLTEGIALGLTGDVEKRSEVLGRNAIFKKSTRIARLPKYLCVQMMRFYWKATPDSRDHAGLKCKMLRPVSFPASNFDVFDFCTPALQAFLREARSTHGDANGMAFGGVKKPRLDVPAAAAAAAAPAISAAGAGEDDELAAALRMSLGADAGGAASSAPTQAVTAAPLTSAGVGLPAAFRGFYELFAIVSHKGRSADSGHYMGWSRTAGDEWVVFDDDSASETTTEYVLSHLKGGGDDHMAYLLFYRAVA